MQKTLGGDRLGSGKKMKVELHNYERSTHDLGYLWRSTMSAGTLVPFMSEIALPGDTFDINLGCEILTHPTVGPLFGSYKVQLDVFQCPIRLYNSLLHNNMLGIGMDMSRVKLPVISLPSKPITGDVRTIDLDNAQINPSCLLSYLGIRGVGYNTTDATQYRYFNGTNILSYWDIYKNYYSNKQEEIGAVIHNAYTAAVETIDTITINAALLPEYPDILVINDITEGTDIEIVYTGGTPPNLNEVFVNLVDYGTYTLESILKNVNDDGIDTITAEFTTLPADIVSIFQYRYKTADDQISIKPTVVTFDLNNIDEMRKDILSYSNEAAGFIINTDLQPYVWLGAASNGVNNMESSQEGLALKTYQSDLFNNWLQTEWIDGENGIAAITAIDTSGGSFTIDTLNLSKKVYDLLNRIAVSGGTYDDYLDAAYGETRYMRAETPMYMGGLIKELVFQEVINNSGSAEQPLGTLAGRGVMSGKHKGGTVIIKVDEPSYIIGIVSLTPRLDYSQGNKWDMGLQTIADLHVPALDEIGFQDLITEQMAWWDTNYNEADGTWTQKSAGKQPAWINYMTNVNQTRGNFAVRDNEMFMTLNRRYQPEKSGELVAISDLTTYIDPSLYNNIFAETALDSQNFWTQIAVDITARRKMSAKIMPNL